MKSQLLIAGLTAAVTLMFTPAQAAKPKAPPADAPAPAAPAEKAKKDTYPLYGEVVAVTPKLLTTKGGKGKEDHKFDITADTKIVDGDKAATLADIKVGKKVGGYVKKAEGAGNPTLLKINVGVAQEAKPKKADDGAAPKKKAA
ncbi:MAG: hypothetical protein JWO94_2261 [Verrucomicrobiaceae bacterium]|nr:hypothetical protein [Verrucomicrobiaceae bacterium]